MKRKRSTFRRKTHSDGYGRWVNAIQNYHPNLSLKHAHFHENVREVFQACRTWSNAKLLCREHGPAPGWTM